METLNFNDFQLEFTRIRDEYITLKQRYRELSLHQAPDFNIFKLLGMEREEIRTHSTFLSALLNPIASHGQGNLFLKKFLLVCTEKFEDFPKSDGMEEGRWNCHSETTTHYGRIDIVISNPDLGFLIAIENKIDAGEQNRQLERYWQWLQTRRENYPYQALVYLTVRGVSAYTSFGYPYFRLSYKKDIRRWLELSLPDIQAPGVREIVNQYLGTIIEL